MLLCLTQITCLIDKATSLLESVIPILMVLATIVFFWGVIGYLTAAGDEEKKKIFKYYISWGIIGLFAMMAVWGLVKVLIKTFGIPRIGLLPSPPCLGEFSNLLCKIVIYIVGPLVSLLFVLATVVFLWGVIEFISASGSGDDKKIEAGKKHIIWGIIALFAMVSVFGIVGILRFSFGFWDLPYFLPINP